MRVERSGGRSLITAHASERQDILRDDSARRHLLVQTSRRVFVFSHFAPRARAKPLATHPFPVYVVNSGGVSKIRSQSEFIAPWPKSVP